MHDYCVFTSVYVIKWPINEWGAYLFLHSLTDLCRWRQIMVSFE